MMPSLCMPCVALASTDVGGLIRSSEETCRLAKELVDLSNDTQKRDRSLIEFASSSRDKMDRLKMDRLKPEMFLKLLELVDENKLMETIATVRSMGSASKQCLDKSLELSKSIQASIDCFPREMMQEEAKVEGDDSEEEEKELIDLEGEIADVKDCTQGIKNMNIFNASQKGTRAFVGLVKECGLIDTIFDRIKELSTKVAQLSQSLMAESCCSQVLAGIKSLKDMKRCLKLSNVITNFADSSQRLVAAILELIETIKTTFGRFIPQFEAAKKIQHSPLMNHVSSLASKFT